ncbi:MAG TPA: nuclear transport factor 2 family protein [Polyangiaceae bacterium]|nr:nuclear transport factor 2 family protein [Polyangiaceae bacterium]
MTTKAPSEIARAFYEAIQSGKHGDALRPFLTEDAVTTEHPNLVKPKGARATLKDMLAASTAGAGLLSHQDWKVLAAYDIGSLAVIRLTWTGTVARDVGPFRAGQVLTAHIAQFVETRDGRVASVETFDCYEPFG